MTDVNTKKAEGLLDEVKGHVKDAAGGLTGDLKMQATGKVDQFAGKAKQEFSDLYDEHETSVEAATSFIQNRPFVALAIIGVVAVIVGRFIFKRRG